MEWLIYLFKVCACTALFFAFYFLLLHKLTFFKTNRFYLLLSLLCSFIIPALHFNVERVVELPVTQATVQMAPMAEDYSHVSAAPIVIPEEPLTWQDVLPYAYGFVTLVLLLVALWRSYQLFKHTRKNVIEVNGLKIVHKNKGFTNCSFFNYVFINKQNLTDEEMQILLRHEQVHANQLHSVDKLFMMLFKILLWFNPVIYLYDKALEQLHEYEADEITSNSFNISLYANLLLKLAIEKQSVPLVHNFVKSPIKERLQMLFNQKSKNMKKLVYVSALPMFFGLLWLFGVQFVYAQNKSLSQTSMKDSSLTKGDEKRSKRNGIQSKKVISLYDEIVKVTINDASNQLTKPKDTLKLLKANLIIIDTAIRADIDVNLQDNPGCKITSIEGDDKYTIVNFEYTAIKAGDWVLLNKEIYLQANNDMKHFSYVKSENIPLAPYKYAFAKTGDKLKFKVYFEKVPLTAKSIDVIERAGRSDFFNFYNVSLPPSYYSNK